MSRKDGKFDFKRFSVAHTRSSMKVGVDGVLIALWADLPQTGDILDVGCGCGVISLICAQRSEALSTKITAIDIDNPSVEEAGENFRNSPWSGRLSVRKADFNDFVADASSKPFGLVISNPPYFDSGVVAGESRRLAARHQGALSPSVLIASARRLLVPGGYLAMVVPAEYAPGLEAEAIKEGLYPVRITIVRGHVEAPAKRALLQFRLSCQSKPSILLEDDNYSPKDDEVEEKDVVGDRGEVIRDELVLEVAPGVPTDDYRRLGAPFYLRF